MPVASQDGLSASVERHFGRAAWFLIGTFDDNRLLDHRVVKNPFQERKVRAGLAVINWLVDEMRISAAILREVGEIAYHTLRDHYVEVFRASDGTVRDVLDAYAAGQLKHLPEPTHSSEIRIEDRRGADKEIEETIRQTLSKVIDPETGADVLRMGLIRHMVAENGRVRLTFRPSSPVCPQAFKLGEAIRQAVHGVPGVQQVKIKVENFNRAEELEALLQE